MRDNNSDSTIVGQVDRANYDRVQIRRFSCLIRELAKAATGHLSDPGVLQIDAKRPDDNGTKILRFEIDDVDGMVDEAMRGAELGFNVWIEGRTVPRESNGRGETRHVFALVVDYDGSGLLPRGMRETFAVQTSRDHAHLWLGTSLTPAQGEELGARLRRAVKADQDTGVISQPYRVAGTPNYPTPVKRANGRGIEPTFLVSEIGQIYAADELNQLLSAAGTAGNGTPGGLHGSYSGVVRPVAAVDALLPKYAWILLNEPAPDKRDSERYQRMTLFGQARNMDRSVQFARAACTAFKSGITPLELEALILAQFQHGCARKYLERGRLREELERIWQKR